MKLHPRGFTLVEVIIATAILAITVAIGVPAYQSAIGSARIGEVQTELNRAMTTAMRHAMVTSKPVVLCPSVNGDDCTPGVDWSKGWIAFADHDGNRQRNADDQLIWRQGGLPAGIRLFSTAGRTRLVFHANGDNPGSNVTFTICHRSAATRTKTVMLANNGRIRQSSADSAASMLCKAA